jgi:hypothetical protein
MDTEWYMCLPHTNATLTIFYYVNILHYCTYQSNGNSEVVTQSNSAVYFYITTKQIENKYIRQKEFKKPIQVHLKWVFSKAVLPAQHAFSK